MVKGVKVMGGRGGRERGTVKTHQAAQIASKIEVPCQHDDDALRCGGCSVSNALI